MIEFGPTNDVITKPKRTDTDEYITGRLG
jgi:ABC-type phosphate transport system ATPase subunit